MTTAWRELDALYAQVPAMSCAMLCGSFCTTGPIPIGAVEWERIVEHLGYAPEGNRTTWVCPLYKDGLCTIHPIRPMICRLWGLTEGMECSHGCRPSRMLTRAEGHQLIQSVYAIGGVSYWCWGEDAFTLWKGAQNVKLTVGERLNLLQIVPDPEKAHVALYRALDEFRRSVGFRPEEFEQFGMRVVAACVEHKQDKEFPAGIVNFGTCDLCGAPLMVRSYRWDVARDAPVDVAMPTIVNDLIADTLKKMDENGELTRWLIPLYEKFVEGKNAE